MQPIDGYRRPTTARIVLRGLLLIGAAMLAAGPARAQGFISPPPHVNPPASAVAGHPRLLLTANDVGHLRNWAVATNPCYADLSYEADQAKGLMDSGTVPGQ